jgi:hypothetical protein
MPCSASSVNPFPGRPVVRMLSFSTSCSFSQWMVVSPYSHTSRRLRIPPQSISQPSFMTMECGIPARCRWRSPHAHQRVVINNIPQDLLFQGSNDPCSTASRCSVTSILRRHRRAESGRAHASYPFYHLSISCSYVHRILPFHV